MLPFYTDGPHPVEYAHPGILSTYKHWHKCYCALNALNYHTEHLKKNVTNDGQLKQCCCHSDTTFLSNPEALCSRPLNKISQRLWIWQQALLFVGLWMFISTYQTASTLSSPIYFSTFFRFSWGFRQCLSISNSLSSGYVKITNKLCFLTILFYCLWATKLHNIVWVW